MNKYVCQKCGGNEFTTNMTTIRDVTVSFAANGEIKLCNESDADSNDLGKSYTCAECGADYTLLDNDGLVPLGVPATKPAPQLQDKFRNEDALVNRNNLFAVILQSEDYDEPALYLFEKALPDMDAEAALRKAIDILPAEERRSMITWSEAISKTPRDAFMGQGLIPLFGHDALYLWNYEFGDDGE